MGDDGTRAEALSTTALLNCLIREVARPERDPEGAAGHRAYRLPATGRLLRVRAGRHPREPALRTAGGWRALTLARLVELAAEELGRHTGRGNPALPAEIADSRDVMAALLAARDSATPPEDPYLRSEQALLAGHRYHPAPKARGAGSPDGWLPYAPEAYARFPLELLGVREDLVAGDGDASALDVLGAAPPDGYRLLPAHPWQLALLGALPAFRDGRLLRLGRTAGLAVPTSSLRTVYLPDADLFCKFSLDVRITNDIRRLWLRDLRWLRIVDELLAAAFADLPPYLPLASVLSDRGYRTADLGGRDAYEALAVVVRDGLGTHLKPGVTPLLAAGVSEGFPGNPLDGTTPEAALGWWQRYLDHVVPPVLHAGLRHGVVLECHLQNVLVCVDEEGLPAQVLFRDHEGVKLVAERHRAVLGRFGPGTPNPGVSAERGWERLVYCLVVNNLAEIAGAIHERHPELGGELWRRARAVFADYAADHGDPPEVRELLTAAHLPAKANLLLRWRDADGGSSRYVPVPNPLRAATG
ncbi:IucA/IucC family siderophore biosynthesis protein [Streptomyces sp. LX-29]|uniref:IucA/IucC family protein n=1 Tax=Streptomyces sp. LX-29 TaxID=2900152 RepID=UPI00240D62D4|nr:IucA/IucC family C-terminal-domain containing protein [Streptomyces sp. LX-29]WFB08911.1 IucA/IucC family siderophore biosynthesis protein [Streptomyces sp. LX-29]